MNNKYLDDLLTTISIAVNGEVKNIFIEQIDENDLRMGLNYLSTKGYIGQKINSEFEKHIWTVSIREEGKVFLSNGGFVMEDKIRKSPLRANLIAKWAISISIIATIISILALIK